MELLHKLHNFLAFHLSKKSKFDGRFLLGAILLLYFVPILISFFLADSYEKTINQWWIFPLVPKMWPSFRDLRVITSGYECYKLGYEPRIENPCDPYDPPMPMNYPKIWLSLASFGINQSHTVTIGIIIAILFFIFVFFHIKRLNYTEALLYSAVVCSPSVMLGIERGNNDLIIFSILSISLIFTNSQHKSFRIFSYFTILLAAFLKLYPVFCLTVFLKEKKKILFFITCFFVSIFSVYVIASLDDIKLVSQATLRADFWSYGYKIVYELLDKDMEKLVKILKFDKYSINQLLPITKFDIFTVLINVVCLIFAITACSIVTHLIIKSKSVNHQQSYNFDANNGEFFIDAFRVGASIYIGSFLIGNNWAYRLIFIIFTLPQIFAWIKYHHRFGVVSSLSLVGFILNLWLKMIGNWSPSYIERLCMYFSQLIDWLLLFYFIYILLLTCPEWIKIKISLVSPKNS